MQSIARSRGTAVSWFPCRTAEAIERSPSILWWMFSISTVASSTRMPIASARPPRVMRLIVWPVSHRATSGPADCERDVQDDDDDAPPVAEEDQHHQPGQDRAEGALGRQAPHGVGDGGRLVELEADLDVVGKDRLHLGQGLLDVPDDREGRGVGPLGHEDVDGAAAVDQCIAGGNVGWRPARWPRRGCRPTGFAPTRIGMVSSSLTSRTSELIGHDRHHLADADVARGADRIAIGQGRDHFVGRDRSTIAAARGRPGRPPCRWLPPNGGGAETPGRLANIGRTLKSAWSWISPIDLVSLDSTR